jgi:hypothetical protein
MKEKKIHKLVRAAVRDVAFQYRMGAGFPGDVNRTHPAEIEPALLLSTNAAFFAFGQMGIVDTASNSIEPIGVAQASDSVDLLPFGALVRSYPTQQQNGTNYGAASIGNVTPPTSGVADFARNALIMVQLNEGVAAPTKGGRVYIWCAATSGDHIQGGYETEASAGNTVRLDPRYTYNGPPDANGVVELSANI